MNNSVQVTTTFDTANSVMKQRFNSRVVLIVDFKNMIIGTFIDDKMVDKIDFEKHFTLLDFEKHQQKVMEQAEKLGGFQNDRQ